MSVVALSGNDTIIINNRNLVNLADGTCTELTFANDIATVKTGKNANAIYGQNFTGYQAEVKLRIVRGTADDQFLNQLLSNQQANFAGFPLLIGNFIKKIGDGQSNITNDTYVLSGGIFIKIVEAKTDADGGSDQSVSMWSMRFAQAVRVLT